MEELLLKLKELDVQICVHENSLKLNIPEKVDESLFLDEIKEYKQDIIGYIQERTAQKELKKRIPKSDNVSQISLTPAQERMYVLQEMAKDSVAYNIPFAVEIKGVIDKEGLEGALKALIRRHESLRTYFVLDENHKPVQNIREYFDFTLEHVRCKEEDVSEAMKAFSRPFHLDQAPLFRARLLEVGKNRYTLLIDIHHIVTDGVSSQIFLKDLMSLYSGFKLPDLQLQYRDYANWYHGPENQLSLDKQRKFWLKELKGYQNTQGLSLDFARPKQISFEGKSIRYSIDKTRKGIIDKICKKTGSPLFSVLLSLFGLLQSKLTGSEDLVIGAPVAGRRHSDLKQIIGMFVNTLALRVHPKKESNFTEYLSHVCSKTVTCFDNQEFPYEKIIDDLGLNKENNINPLFNTLISLNNIDKTESRIDGLEIELLEFEKATSKFDLILHFREDEKELACTFEYNNQIFKKETIDRLFAYMNVLIDQIGENQSIVLKNISLLPKSGQEDFLKTSDFTATGFPSKSTLVTLFEEQVAKTPDNIAVTLSGATLTYKELNERANQVARLLRSKGIEREQIVGLFMDKTIDTVISMIGILKSGGAYLPIDVTYPDQRINYILENSRAKIILSSSNHKPPLEKENISIIYFDEVRKVDDVSNLESINFSKDLCYVLYTSGTTGNPKGVMIEHSNIVRLLFNDAFQFEFGEKDVWTMFHSHCFDFSVWEMYGALLNGGQLIIVPPEIARDPSAYVNLVKENDVTVLNQTPTAFYNLIAEAKKKDLKFPKVRYVVFGGEALKPLKLKDWADSNPHVKLINMYGITETSVHTTFKEIGASEIAQNSSNIGKALPTVSIYLLDEELQPVPKGAQGEIYVGGAGVGRGYLNNEELSKSRFIKNPFNKKDRLYRTGDLAVLLENNELEYRGRSDHQVQLKGFRIELGEIEHHLQENELIENAIVVVKKDKKDQPYLCAYFVGDKELDVEFLRSYLVDRLPSYMIPSYFMKIETIPYTSNNKIALDKLPDPVITELSNYEAPTTRNQKEMAAIWIEHLNVAEIGVNDSFFSLGGDSIKAIGLVSKINEYLGGSLTIADLYTNQTIKTLSKRLGKNQNKVTYESEALKIIENFSEAYREKADDNMAYEAVYPMNGIEQGMVFHSLKEKTKQERTSIDNVVYHEQLSFQIPIDNFDFSIFEKSISLMVQKHPVFRKIYDLENQAHIILKEITPEINYIDARHLSKKEMPSYMRQKRDEEILKGTDLSFSVLWRMTIVKFNPYNYLIFDFHHSLLDGWSLQSFIAEFNIIYFSLEKDPSFIPNPLNITYYDQILSEITATLNEDNIAYWKKELQGYQRLELPRTGLRHKHKTQRYGLGGEFRIPLEKIATELDTTLKHLCFAAFVYAMKMISFNNDLTVGVTTNNRPVKKDGEKLLGCFLNTLPVRAKIPEGITWGDYIKYIDDKLKLLKKYDNMPLYKVVDIIDEKTNDQNPIFDVFFNYIDFHVMENLVHEVSNWDELDGDNFMVTNNLIEMHFDAFQNKLDLWVTYSTTVMDESFSNRLAQYVKNILKAFIEKKSATIFQNDILGDEEKNRLNSFNNFTMGYGTDKTILDLFKEQVRSTPDKISIVFEKESLTFNELDVKSNQLAHKLIERGVKFETLVPICVDRSLEMSIGILAILKAGGAYVPIDPTYPQKRINYILDDIQSSFILTESVHKDMFEIPKLILDDTALYKEQDKSYPKVKVAATSLAYVIYTSGTTGKPKGVMNTHAGIFNRLSWMRDYFQVNGNDSIVQKTSFCFDVSVWELILPLITGAKLVFAKPEGHKDTDYLKNLLNKENITLIHFVPSMLSMFLLDLKEFEGGRLRAVICSGEELKPSTVKDFQNKLSSVGLFNLYGPTEAAIDVTAIELTNYEDGMVPIGKPIANTQIYIVDGENNLNPVGVKGELLIGGVQVARGYLNKPELTSLKFISNSFDQKDAYKLYRTGDMARWMPDGNIEFLGRIDNQIKVRGNRIELDEIENNLTKHPKVRLAVVAYREYNGEFYIIAYYTVKKEESIDVDDLKSFMRESLPEYMIPSYFVQLQELPITENGKLDRKSLQNPEYIRKNKLEPPQTEEETSMVKIWSEVLEIEFSKISVMDNFFDIGGNSIKVIELVNKIRKIFSKDIMFGDIFNYPEIRLFIQEVLKSKTGIDITDINEPPSEEVIEVLEQL